MTESETISAIEIQRRLIADRFPQGKVCPNYTPRGWFECDVFEISKRGYFNEFEIKLSRADFRADRFKTKRWEIIDGHYRPSTTTKHQRLAQGDPKGPRRFWYVAPAGLISRDEIPAWAGFIQAGRCDRRPPYDLNLTIAHVAPVLHNCKADPRILPHVEGIYYYRFMRMFVRGASVEFGSPEMGLPDMDLTFNDSEK